MTIQKQKIETIPFFTTFLLKTDCVTSNSYPDSREEEKLNRFMQIYFYVYSYTKNKFSIFKYILSQNLTSSWLTTVSWNVSTFKINSIKFKSRSMENIDVLCVLCIVYYKFSSFLWSLARFFFDLANRFARFKQLLSCDDNIENMSHCMIWPI